ncbi:MAG: hypothetical protein FJ088_01950 [Deltaproteobacteria bacterium]|nr:hypothetical protein [Deltaproteobacteria bacterium]
MNRIGIFNSLRLVLVVFAAFLSASCEEDLGKRQEKAVGEKSSAVMGKLRHYLEEIVDEMGKTIPDNAEKKPGLKHPFMTWRMGVLEFPIYKKLFELEAEAKRLPVEAEIGQIIEYFKGQEQFFGRELKLKEYLELAGSLLENTKEALLKELISFDLVFLHVEPFYGVADMPDEAKTTYFFRHWQIAFRFVRDKFEAVDPYIERLCKEKLKDFCSTLPFEFIPDALQIPYVKAVISEVDEFASKFPESRFNSLLKVFKADLEKELLKEKKYTESPVLPDSVSKRPFVGDMVFTITPEAVNFGEKSTLALNNGRIKNPGDLAGFKKSVAETIKKMTEEKGPENMEAVLIDADAAVKMEVVKAIYEAVKDSDARTLLFGARRRIEGVNRRTVAGGVSFKDVAMKERKFKGMTCLPLGFSNPYEEAKGEPEEFLLVAAGQAQQAEGKKYVYAGVDSKITYGDFVKGIDRLYSKCAKEDCVDVSDAKIQIEMGLCL